MPHVFPVSLVAKNIDRAILRFRQCKFAFAIS